MIPPQFTFRNPNLNAAVYSGYSDFRIPNSRNLSSVLCHLFFFPHSAFRIQNSVIYHQSSDLKRPKNLIISNVPPSLSTSFTNPMTITAKWALIVDLIMLFIQSFCLNARSAPDYLLIIGSRFDPKHLEYYCPGENA